MLLNVLSNWDSSSKDQYGRSDYRKKGGDRGGYSDRGNSERRGGDRGGSDRDRFGQGGFMNRSGGGDRNDRGREKYGDSYGDRGIKSDRGGDRRDGNRSYDRPQRDNFRDNDSRPQREGKDNRDFGEGFQRGGEKTHGYPRGGGGDRERREA